MSDFHLDDILKGNNYSLQMSGLSLIVEDDHSDTPLSSQVARQARILHEYDHLVRILGTPYGLIKHGLFTYYLEYFLKSFSVREALPNLVRDWNKVGSLVKPRMTTEELELFYFGDTAHSDVYRARCFFNSIRTLDGRNLGNVGIDVMAGWSHYVFALCGQNSEAPEQFFQNLNMLWGKHPGEGSLIYIDGRPINIPDILEYLGVVVETAYFTQYSKTESQFPPDLSAKLYLQILNVVKEYVPKAFNYSNFTMAQEVEGLLELSLWSPLWPGMNPDELPQHAIHLIPSYRLGYILDACRKLDVSFSFDDNLDVEQVSSRVREIQEKVCRHLGWKPPAYIAEKWHSALGEIEQSPDTWTKYFFHHPRSRRTAWSKQLILEFGNEPVSGPMLAGSRHYGKINFPTIYNKNQEEHGYMPNGEIDWPEEDRHFQRMDVLLFTASSSAVKVTDWVRIPDPDKLESYETWRRLIDAKPFVSAITGIQVKNDLIILSNGDEENNQRFLPTLKLSPHFHVERIYLRGKNINQGSFFNVHFPSVCTKGVLSEMYVHISNRPKFGGSVSNEESDGNARHITAVLTSSDFEIHPSVIDIENDLSNESNTFVSEIVCHELGKHQIDIEIFCGADRIGYAVVVSEVI